MPLFAVLFEDHTADADAIRRRLMPEHLAFLERHAGTIEAAGPLKAADGSPAGGLWLVTAETAEAVERLVHEDPFWPTGLRKSVRICAWTQVFAGGRRRI
ncbi:hypothetical protein GCM10011611_01540 [Aliidongia dinghuensis]|uniref:YCII-related domain-containing protein n=1 Tax=Aliidongia dinghuensis TaxID=1867774 RepID=A0A8J2YPJ6_9PROT|nr:YciI family protein [Aliidongia dinghuensis]GGE99634.1 hypothetical protein GCM10011611_01540 [Aliidongia dinghuensis]